MGKTIGRKLVDISQKARGRQALRYEFEVIPYFCGDIPDGVEKVLFAWERGSKLFVTDAENVNSNTHAVFWKQYLRQAATIYKENNEFLPKEFSFKVQSVKTKSKGDERKTVGKVHVDLAQFCTEQSDAQPQEVFLQLKPSGKLKCSIKATWLRNAKVDMDAMTEVTHHSDYAQSHPDEEAHDEQDLSGFDPETGEPIPDGNGHASGSGYYEEYDETTGEYVQRKKKKKKHRKHRQREVLPDEIPEGFDAPEDPNEVHEQHEEGAQASTADGTPAPKTPKSRASQPKDTANMDAGRQVQKTTMKDLLCCCLPKSGPQQDALERDGLLKQQRVMEMRYNNRS